ncbi:unnamed protein product [Cochlearia groenlandica]
MVDGESTSTSYSDNNNLPNDQDHDFECNICFELAQDPIVTLCGHLFCWPCLYRWLHHHSHSQECPVCKAIVEDDKLVPLYGRGKNQTDPRTKRYPGIKIPNRPPGQRPDTAPPPPTSSFFDLMGGFMPVATTRFGSFSIGFGGFLPTLFNLRFHGFHDAALFGGYHNGFRGYQEGNNNQPMTPGEQIDAFLKKLAFMIGFSVLIFILCCFSLDPLVPLVLLVSRVVLSN